MRFNKAIIKQGNPHMEKTNDEEYFKLKKPAAIALIVVFGALLAGAITFVVLDHLKLGELEDQIDSLGSSSMQMPGGGMGGGTPPDMNGDFDDSDRPELPSGEAPSDMPTEGNPSGKSSNNSNSSSSNN